MYYKNKKDELMSVKERLDVELWTGCLALWTICKLSRYLYRVEFIVADHKPLLPLTNNIYPLQKCSFVNFSAVQAVMTPRTLSSVSICACVTPPMS